MATLVFNSCTKSGSSQLEVIPADAMMVISVQGNQLIKKGGLDDLSQFDFFEKMTAEINDIEDVEVRNAVNGIIKKPKETGLDIEQIFAYVNSPALAENEQTEPSGALIFKLNSAQKFEENINKFSEGDVTIEEGEGYKAIKLDRELAAVWNNDILVLQFSPSLEDIDYAEILSTEKNILSVPAFKEFDAKKGDISLWVAYDNLMEVYQKELGGMINFPKGYDMSGIFMNLFLNFENGEVNVAFQMTPKSKMKELNDKFPIVKEKFDNRLLDDFPATSFLTMKLGLNFNEYVKLIKEMFVPDSGFVANDYKTHAMLQQMEEIQATLDNPTVKIITDAIAGDVLINIHGFAQGMPIPLFGLDFTVKDEQAFQNLLALLPDEITSSLIKNDKYYMISAQGLFAIYIAYKDNRVFITDDSNAIEAFVGKGHDKTLKSVDDSKLKNSLLNDLALFYINLDLDTYPPAIKNLIRDKKILEMLSYFKDFTVGSTSISEGNITLRLKNEEQNSLKTIMELLDKQVN